MLTKKTCIQNRVTWYFLSHGGLFSTYLAGCYHISQGLCDLLRAGWRRSPCLCCLPAFPLMDTELSLLWAILFQEQSHKHLRDSAESCLATYSAAGKRWFYFLGFFGPPYTLLLQPDHNVLLCLGSLERVRGLHAHTEEHWRRQEHEACSLASLMKGTCVPVFHPEGLERMLLITCDLLLYIEPDLTWTPRFHCRH